MDYNKQLELFVSDTSLVSITHRDNESKWEKFLWIFW